MKAPWNFARFLPLAGRLLARGRLPTLLFAVASKGAAQGNRLGKLKDDLRLLHRERYNSLLSVVQSHSREVIAGKIHSDKLVGPALRFLEAVRDVETNLEARAKVYRKCVDFLRSIETILEERFKAGVGSIAAVDEFRSVRLEAAIQLLLAERGAKGLQPGKK